MSEQGVISGLTNRKRIERARRNAEEAGLLIKISEASWFAPALYTFGRVATDTENGNVIEHFQQKWKPVLRQKMRQNNILERVHRLRFD